MGHPPIPPGALTVQVGTANFYDPRATEHVRAGMAAFMRERNVASLDQIRGTVKVEG